MSVLVRVCNRLLHTQSIAVRERCEWENRTSSRVQESKSQGSVQASLDTPGCPGKPHWATLKPKVWIRYVDDTFVIWPHDAGALRSFHNHLNSQHVHPATQFTIEEEAGGQIPFLYRHVDEERKGQRWKPQSTESPLLRTGTFTLTHTTRGRR